MQYYAAILSKSQFEHWGHFFLGEYEQPLSEFEQRVENGPDNYYARGHLAFMYANTGDSVKVRHMLDYFESIPVGKYDFGNIYYYQGVVHALLGHKEEAMKYLRKAFADGYMFGYHSYSDDFRLRTLFDYPPFQEFVKPRDSSLE